MIVKIGEKSWDLPDFNGAGATNEPGFILCDCPQSKAIEKGCNLGACRNVSLNDYVASYNAKVKPATTQIIGAIGEEVSAFRFTGLLTQAANFIVYLKAIQDNVFKHRNWLKRMLEDGGTRKRKCCQSDASLSNAIATDDSFYSTVSKDYDAVKNLAAQIVKLEEAYTSDVVQDIDLQTQVNQFNANVSATQVEIAENTGKVSAEFLQDTAKRILLVVAGLVGLYAIYKLVKK